MINKQLISLGCSPPEFTTPTHEQVISLFLYTSDGGSDQVSYRRLTEQLLDNPVHSQKVFMSVTCLMHSAQLITKTTLLLLDDHLINIQLKSWRYYSSVAKLVHLWNDNSRAIFNVWRNSFGSEAAVKFAKNTMPRCIGGRWGSVFNVEALLSKLNPKHASAVINAVIAKRSMATLDHNKDEVSEQDQDTCLGTPLK